MSLAPGQRGPRPWRQFVAVWICAYMLVSGCRSIPRPRQRSIEELYFEAMATPKPESTLGMTHPVGEPLNNEQPFEEFMQTPVEQMLLPNQPAPAPQLIVPPTEPGGIPLTPPAMAPQSAPTPISHVVPQTLPTTLQAVAHVPPRAGIGEPGGSDGARVKRAVAVGW